MISIAGARRRVVPLETLAISTAVPESWIKGCQSGMRHDQEAHRSPVRGIRGRQRWWSGARIDKRRLSRNLKRGRETVKEEGQFSEDEPRFLGLPTSDLNAQGLGRGG
jgi:hypothetical protein